MMLQARGLQGAQADCEAAVPWYCAAGWIPLIGAPIAFSQTCREAYDLERACMAGGYPNPLPGPGAGPAPDVAVTDPTNVEEIRRQQEANDRARYEAWIEANRNILEGAPERPESDFCGERLIPGVSNCILYAGAALALVVVLKR